MTINFVFFLISKFFYSNTLLPSTKTKKLNTSLNSIEFMNNSFLALLVGRVGWGCSKKLFINSNNAVFYVIFFGKCKLPNTL